MNENTEENTMIKTEEDSDMCEPPEITEAAEKATANLLPEKSRTQYERAYKLFMEWHKDNSANSFSETVLLAYFQNLKERMKPTSLWAIYSMLRMTINLKHNIDIGKYLKLCAFLKRFSDGYKPKKSKILSPQQVQEFLSIAPDKIHLFTKVGFIFGFMGACRREELLKIETTHVEDHGTSLLVNIPGTNTNKERQFVIGGDFYSICKKYMELRPPASHANTTRFFLNYQRGKCTRQPVGINKFGSLANKVAKYLCLPDHNLYTGHCMRRSAASNLVNSAANITAANGGWCSASIDHSIFNNIQTLMASRSGEDSMEMELLQDELDNKVDDNVQTLEASKSGEDSVKLELQQDELDIKVDKFDIKVELDMKIKEEPSMEEDLRAASHSSEDSKVQYEEVYIKVEKEPSIDEIYE